MSENARLASSVLCVGFPGTTAAEAPLRELAELGPAAVVLFAHNVGTPVSTRVLVDAVCSAVAERTGVRPLVAIDQEGGRVARLRAGAHELPSAMALGAADDEGVAEAVGRLAASDLRAAGVDLNFAPVLDLALVPEATVIGTRSFGDRPVRVAQLALAFARGLERGGVTATFKHFPGHGGVVADSHVALPRLNASEAILRERDFVPFERAIAAGARAIMSAHVVVAALDPDRPATLSPRIMTGLLRDEFGFAGAVFSDCLEMAAIADGPGVARAGVQALAAGIDGLVVSHHLDAARATRDAVADSIRDGTLERSRVRNAAERLQTARSGTAGEGAVDTQAARTAARRAIAIIRAEPGALPLQAAQPLTVISFEGVTLEGAAGRHADFPSLSHALRVRGIRSELLRVPLDPSETMIESLVALARAQHGRPFALVARRALLNPMQRSAIAALLEAVPHAVLICAREPFDATAFDAARTVVCSFGDEGIAIEALADALCGRCEASGSMPVRLVKSDE